MITWEDGCHIRGRRFIIVFNDENREAATKKIKESGAHNITDRLLFVAGRAHSGTYPLKKKSKQTKAPSIKMLR